MCSVGVKVTRTLFSLLLLSMQMFSDDIFGRVDPELHTVTSGRWAYLEIPKSNVTVGPHHKTFESVC
jgi:hypothetical protein